MSKQKNKPSGVFGTIGLPWLFEKMSEHRARTLFSTLWFKSPAFMRDID